MDIKVIVKNEDGSFPAYAWPGGYPIVYYSAEGNVYCPECANQTEAEPEIAFWDIYYEGGPEICNGCGTLIESAYGDPEEDNDS